MPEKKPPERQPAHEALNAFLLKEKIALTAVPVFLARDDNTFSIQVRVSAEYKTPPLA